MTVQEQIEAKLIAALSPEILELENESHLHAGHAGSPNSGESHFKLTIKAETLSDLTRLERYRRVHTILAEELAGPVHALSISFL